MTDAKDTSQPVSTKAASHIETIEPSGATDDIRYVLHQKDDQHDQQPIESTAAVQRPNKPQGDPTAPVTSGGLADQVIDDVDAELPDTTQSTISGGQVANESKRGAY